MLSRSNDQGAATLTDQEVGYIRTWQGARGYTEAYGSKVLGAKQYRLMSAKHERGSMRRTRSGRDVASRVVSLEPVSAANRGTASYDSQSNVRKCSSYFVARDRSHRGGETPCGIGMRLRGSSQRHQASHRHLCASSASAEHGGSRRAAGTGWQLEPPRDVARAQMRAEIVDRPKGFAARGHLRRQRGGVRLSHRRRAGRRSKRTSHWRVGNVRSNYSVEEDSLGSDQPISRKADRVRNVSLRRRDVLTPTVCGESCVGAMRDVPVSSSTPSDGHRALGRC